MKKLLLLFVSVITISCSNDDSPAPTVNNTVQILGHSYEVHETVGQFKSMKWTATVKNNTSSTVAGSVQFTIPDTEDDGEAYYHIHDVSIDAGETKTVTGVDGLFTTETLNVSKVEFIQD